MELPGLSPFQFLLPVWMASKLAACLKAKIALRGGNFICFAGCEGQLSNQFSHDLGLIATFIGKFQLIENEGKS